MSLTNLEMYTEMKNKVTEDLYEWLKTEFSDVCSHGDRIINSHIDNMYNKIEIPPNNLIYFNYIYNAWKENYMNNIEANPWWAS